MQLRFSVRWRLGLCAGNDATFVRDLYYFYKLQSTYFAAPLRRETFLSCRKIDGHRGKVAAHKVQRAQAVSMYREIDAFRSFGHSNPLVMNISPAARVEDAQETSRLAAKSIRPRDGKFGRQCVLDMSLHLHPFPQTAGFRLDTGKMASIVNPPGT
ncbi:hypothetical protein LZ31DRAFT_559648 [Colletotrichum somersetense]|nr:hypothetical protein LZ31DRAFT_559648 [Colletotrichum somersetense]